MAMAQDVHDVPLRDVHGCVHFGAWVLEGAVAAHQTYTYLFGGVYASVVPLDCYPFLVLHSWNRFLVVYLSGTQFPVLFVKLEFICMYLIFIFLLCFAGLRLLRHFCQFAL